MCDAARIAREVVKDDPETTPEEVLACVAKGFGFTHISLSRVRTVESAVVLTKIPIKPILSLLKRSLTQLSRVKVLRDYLGPILVILDKVIDIADILDATEPEQKKVEEVINKDKCNCKIKEKPQPTR